MLWRFISWWIKLIKNTLFIFQQFHFFLWPQPFPVSSFLFIVRGRSISRSLAQSGSGCPDIGLCWLYEVANWTPCKNPRFLSTSSGEAGSLQILSYNHTDHRTIRFTRRMISVLFSHWLSRHTVVCTVVSTVIIKPIIIMLLWFEKHV